MRYIKTKDNVFEVVDENELVYRVRAKKDNDNIYSKSKRCTDVLKESDDLLDLLDRIIIKPSKRGERYKILRKSEFLKLSSKFVLSKSDYIFGAIVIVGSKGEPTIKSIAYLKEGELELL